MSTALAPRSHGMFFFLFSEHSFKQEETNAQTLYLSLRFLSWAFAATLNDALPGNGKAL